MGLTPVSFVGISEFSEAFQEILQRTFQIGSLPIQRLQTEQERVVERRNQLSSLSSTLGKLQSAFQTLGLAAGNGGLVATSSDESVATAAVTGNAGDLSFKINVTSAASAAQEASLTALAATTTTALSAQNDGVYRLTVGGTVTNLDLLATGSGRTAGAIGGVTPSPPVSVQVDFSNGLSGTISADLNSFFVASAAPSGAGPGDTISVNFVSEDLSINESIVTAPLTGAEGTAAIAGLLNDQIALNASLNGKVSFSEEGGNLKLVVSDSVGQGFTFTSSSTGTLVSGLEPGGVVGGHSAQEIAAALNAKVALSQPLVAAGVTFSALNGEVRVNGDQAFDITVTDSAQGTGFASGLAGTTTVTGFADTLQGLRDFINSQTATLGVKATIINTSSDAAVPQFRLTLTATQTGETTLTLKDSAAADLLTTANQGSNAIFTVDGLPLNNPRNTITNFAPDFDLTIVGPGSATVATGTDRGEVSKSLADTVLAYNDAVAAIQSQIGEDAGLLSGAVEVRQAQHALRQITSFTATAGLRSMRELGLELADNGQLSFKSSKFNSLTDQEFQDALTYLGDLVTGFAGNAVKQLDSLTNPLSGQIRTAINFLKESDEHLADQILQAQERLDRTIITLEQRFAAADLLLSQLESQQNLLTEFIKAGRNEK